MVRASALSGDEAEGITAADETSYRYRDPPASSVSYVKSSFISKKF
jgi:thymidine phosphorylase